MAGKEDLVRQQYEALPYPARDPAEEKKRLIVGSPSHLLELEHYVLAGRRAGPLKVLVAGGGTGDGAIMIAQQLADRGAGGEVLYLDLSSASLAVAKARAAVRGLDNIRFEQGSLLDVGQLAAGPFDYIDCCGVLHHLPDPAAGLKALASALSDQGGIGLMLYGPYGRTGVYAMQRALARLFPEDLPASKRLAGARQVVAGLPDGNWLKRNPFVADHLAGDDTGFFDLLLHSQDRAFSVPEIFALANDVSLRITGFLEPAKYDPALYLEDEGARKRARALPWPEQCALAEELAGSLKTHVCYLVNIGNEAGGEAQPGDMANLPVLRDMAPAAFARAIAKQPILKASFDGASYRRELPKSAAQILSLCDGRHTVGDIRAQTKIPPAVFRRDFYDNLSGFAAVEPTAAGWPRRLT